jgi:hypothetical protein
VNDHSGSNLFHRAMKVASLHSGKQYVDEKRLERLLARLPALWKRCRQNEGY